MTPAGQQTPPIEGGRERDPLARLWTNAPGSRYWSPGFQDASLLPYRLPADSRLASAMAGCNVKRDWPRRAGRLRALPTSWTPDGPPRDWNAGLGVAPQMVLAGCICGLTRIRSAATSRPSKPSLALDTPRAYNRKLDTPLVTNNENNSNATTFAMPRSSRAYPPPLELDTSFSGMGASELSPDSFDSPLFSPTKVRNFRTHSQHRPEYEQHLTRPLTQQRVGTSSTNAVSITSPQRRTSFGFIKSSPTVNVHTTCGRHTDQLLFGGPSLSGLARALLGKKKKRPADS
ncbi:hypothetical protein MKX08_010012 [Trichoderma sp. CBMAI-0020]|nr:hypothetical protein MKX08_010012 [Trichoderma sp. CBMAI-0020]WOD46022.1 hypothetical protein [Trichoderma atroviride]